MALVIVMNVRAQTVPIVLPQGRSIPVRITSEVYSNARPRHQTSPTAIVDTDIKNDDGQHVLIRRGTPVAISAVIRKAKGVGKGAFVQLECLSTYAVDGQQIRLYGNLIRVGKSREGTALGVGLGIGLTVFLPGLFFLCLKGKKVYIPENTLLHNVITTDVYRIYVAD